jgi:hypothetical protein
MIGWRLVALAVLAAVLLAVTFMDVGSAAACGDAQRLVDNDRLAEARTAFVKLLDDDATHDCATTGLTDVASEQCARAKTLAELGRKEESDKQYTAIATSEPVQENRKNCPAALEVASGKTCSDAAAIDAATYPQTAWKAYVALLDEPRQTQCAIEALAHIGKARCDAASALLAGSEKKAAQQELMTLAMAEPIVAEARTCAVKALNG